MDLEQEAISSLTDILHVHGGNIERLEIVRCVMDRHNLWELLCLMPNVRSISVISSILNDSKRRKYPFVRLNHVQELTVLYCDTFMDAIFCLVAPGTVEIFNFSATHGHTFLSGFMAKQKNIKKLSLHDTNPDNEKTFIKRRFFDELQLQELSIMIKGFNGRDATLRDIMMSQAQSLKNLDLSGSIVGNIGFRCIINSARSLEVLKVNVNIVSPCFFPLLASLPDLKELTLINNSSRKFDKQLEMLSKVELSKLEKLEIKFGMMKIPLNTFVLMHPKLLSLKHLYIDCDLDYAFIAACVSYYEGLETLVLRDYKKLPIKDDYIIAEHKNLRQLSYHINISVDSVFPISVGNVFPRLVILEIQTSDDQQKVITMIALILQNFPSLKKLHVDNQSSIMLNPQLKGILISNSRRLQAISFYVVPSSFQADSLAHAFNTILLEGEKLTLANR